MTAHLLTDAGIVLRTLGMIFAGAFVVRYSRQPWRSTAEGRHLMSFSAIVAAFLAYATINNVMAWLDPTLPPEHADGDYPGRLLFGVALYGFVAWAMWRRNHLLTLALRSARRDNDS